MFFCSTFSKRFFVQLESIYFKKALIFFAALLFSSINIDASSSTIPKSEVITAHDSINNEAYIKFQLLKDEIEKDDSIKKINLSNELVKLESQLNKQEKERQNEILKNEQLLSGRVLQNRNTGIATIVVAAIILAIIILLLFRILRRRQNNLRKLTQLNVALLEQKQSLEKLNNFNEARALRTQMNPHFIFNCMSAIQNCILTGKLDQAKHYIEDFSSLLRLLLHINEFDYVPVSKEIEILKYYVALENLRFQNGVLLQIDIDDDIDIENFKVPPLLLQPFVENSIVHGFDPNKANQVIEIKMRTIIPYIDCTISDNGIGLIAAPKNEEHISKAIYKTNERLNLMLGDLNRKNVNLISLNQQSGSDNKSGTVVKINVPII